MSVVLIPIPCRLVFRSAHSYSTRFLSLVIRQQQQRPYHMASAPTDNTAAVSSEIDLSQFTPVTEGKATILFPKGNEVFYNPVQEFNRDMSVAAIRTWSEMFLGEKRARIEKKVANSKGMCVCVCICITIRIWRMLIYVGLDEKQKKESEEVKDL